MTIPIDRTAVLRTALTTWDALNPGDPLEEIETAATDLAEAARVVIAQSSLEHALDDWSTLQGEAPVDVVQRSAERLRDAAAAVIGSSASPFTPSPLPAKNPMLLAREAMDRVYGIGTDWEEPNEHGEEGFTRAQAESDIDADEILAVIVSAIEADRAQQRRIAAATPESDTQTESE